MKAGLRLRSAVVLAAVCTIALAATSAAHAGTALVALSPRLQTVAIAGHPASISARARGQALLAARFGPDAFVDAPPSATLQTDPIWITVGDVRYRMTVFAFRALAPGFGPPVVEVILVRPAGGAAPADDVQQHEYVYSARGMVFNLDTAGLRTAKVDLRKLFPTRISTLFTATSPVASSPCRLAGGGTGRYAWASGTLASRSFAVHTGSSPFFGTITLPPLTATVSFDPGCRQQLIRAGDCPGRIGLFGFSANGYWFAGNAYGDARIEQRVYHQTGGEASVRGHLVDAFTPASDLAVAATPDGATAEWRSAGNPYTIGSATFRSHAAGRFAGRCRGDDGAVHRFAGTEYDGQLTPNAKPLIALLDTGLMGLTARRATLDLVHYTS